VVIDDNLTNATTYNVKLRWVFNGLLVGQPTATVTVTPQATAPTTAPKITAVTKVVINRISKLRVFFLPVDDDGGSPVTNLSYRARVTSTVFTYDSTGTPNPSDPFAGINFAELSPAVASGYFDIPFAAGTYLYIQAHAINAIGTGPVSQVSRVTIVV
jgi:hypothetical protein